MRSFVYNLFGVSGQVYFNISPLLCIALNLSVLFPHIVRQLRFLSIQEYLLFVKVDAILFRTNNVNKLMPFCFVLTMSIEHLCVSKERTP
ncbi:hypothetical protein VNO78_23748 [Psophocarpus tetragonolobus]|uniref:Uncharacterized protein n=1 Tax=Psophocarpus tetragonolobus TaxID=3891 RepID=A0AAN9XE33_PSOTE